MSADPLETYVERAWSSEDRVRELERENAKLRAALDDILEWCEFAHRHTGIEPWGLHVARRALGSSPNVSPSQKSAEGV